MKPLYKKGDTIVCFGKDIPEKFHDVPAKITNVIKSQMFGITYDLHFNYMNPEHEAFLYLVPEYML